MLRKMTKDEAQSLLREKRLGRLGCVTERGPYVVPVNYVFHEGDIYIHSLVGEKIRALRQSPRACFQVDEVQGDYSWRSVIAFGQYEEISNAEEREWFKRRILVRFPHLTPVESLSPAEAEENLIIFRIRVDEITGVGEG